MATHCYQTSDGRVIERTVPVGKKAPKFIVVDGHRACRYHHAEQCKIAGTTSVYCHASTNLGVHPRQVPKLQRLLKSRGVRDTQFNARGDCEVENQSHHNEILRARGMRCEDGGYGDWCGHN